MEKVGSMKKKIKLKRVAGLWVAFGGKKYNYFTVEKSFRQAVKEVEAMEKENRNTEIKYRIDCWFMSEKTFNREFKTNKRKLFKK